jgi:hypothetical protein
MNSKIFFQIYSCRIYFYCFLFCIVLQILFWQNITSKIKPNFNLIPNIPSKEFLKISSLGDNEFLFRINATRIQNAGDVFAGFVSLKYYDYKKLYQWFSLLDDLNYHSNLTPSLAAYIFSNSNDEENLRLIVKYLQEHGSRDLSKNWWWIFQAIYISSNVLKDNDLALELAYELSKNEDVNAPIWTKQMPAFIHAKKGDGCAAFFIIKDIVDQAKSLSVEEMNFVRYFVNERLTKLKNHKFNPNNCKR